MEYTAENLEKAVTLFYRCEAGQQAEAHQWLNEAQNSSEAWSFVWELLSTQSSSEVQFFAATTLHTKLVRYWNEIPVDHYELLKKKILEAIITYANGPKIVLNRLCITLSAFIIRTLPTYWQNAFEELVSSFQPQHLPGIEPERVIWILLEILTVIPEEFQTTILSVSQRNSVRSILQGVSKDIMKVIEMCLNPLPSAGFHMSNLTTYLNASRCASAWIQLGGLNIEECSSISQILIELTSFVYWNKMDVEGLSSEEIELMEVTVEALTAIVQHPHTYRYKRHVNKFSISMLYNFQKILTMEKCSEDPNKDVVSNLYNLITILADGQSKNFLENLKSENGEEQKISFDLFNSVLECSNLPGYHPVDESASNLSFGFWYTLQEDVLSMKSLECAQLLLQIKPFYRELVCILLRKSMYPLDRTNWSEDDREVFRCYRQDIADTFIYCYNILNLEMLDILQTRLTGSLSSDVVQWNEVETCLHGYSSVAECIELENLYLPKLMNLIKDIPFDRLNIKVMASALETVGSYHEWIVEHPEELGNIFPFVISALGQYEVAASATMALKDITNTCQKYIVPYADLILVQAQRVLSSCMLKLAEHRRLMFSIGKVLSVLPVLKTMDYLNVILAPSFQELEKLANCEPSPSVKVSLATKLKILATLYSSMYVQIPEGDIDLQPVLVIMQNTMPLYNVIGEKYYKDLEVMEDLGNVLKFAITSLMDDCKPLINDILHLVVSIYKKYPQSSILSVPKTIIIMFSKDEDIIPISQQALTEIVNATVGMCSQCDNNMLSEKWDVMEGFFTMLSQLMKKSPQYIFASNIDTALLFQCAILSLSLPEYPVLRASSSFLVNFIIQSRDVAQATVVQTYGESLVSRILKSLGSNAPRHFAESFSDILLALNKKYCDNLSRWLPQLLGRANFPSNKVTSTQKENFARAVLREKANKRKLAETVLEFALICRGILREDSVLL